MRLFVALVIVVVVVAGSSMSGSSPQTLVEVDYLNDVLELSNFQVMLLGECKF